MRHEVPLNDALSSAVEPKLLEASRVLDPERRVEMGQFLTPPSVACFMTSLLELGGSSVRVLDAGAGVGTLTAAVTQEAIDCEYGPRELRSVAYELDDSLEPRLRGVLEFCRHYLGPHNKTDPSTVLRRRLRSLSGPKDRRFGP